MASCGTLSASGFTTPVLTTTRPGVSSRPSRSTTRAEARATSTRRRTSAYNLDDKLTTLVALKSVTGNQTTEWVCGTTMGESGEASFDLLREKIYPEGGKVAYPFNRLGEIGTVHAYEYD